MGSELIPPVDQIHTFDTTLDVITTNFFFQDSALPQMARTVTGNAPEMMLGHISNDPQFGQSTAVLYMQLMPPFFPFPYQVKDSLYLDSVVLCLRWTGLTIGDTDLLQKINVYQLDSTLNPDSAYRTNASFAYSNFLGSKTFAPNILDDSLFLFRQKVKNQLRIRLDDAFGNTLLGLGAASGQPLYNDTSFNQFLKGYALVPDQAGASSANALMGFAISDTNSYLRIYYRYDTLGKQDTTYKTYSYNLRTGFANNINRDYSGSQITSAVATKTDTVAYMQTSPGSYTTIRMPSLDGFKAAKGNVVIHRAELSMQQIATTGQGDDIFTPPDYLYIDYRDTVNNIQLPFLRDGFNLGAYSPSSIGGIRKYVSGPGGAYVAQYVFNIPGYVQGIITRNNNNFPIFLYSPFVVKYSSFFISAQINRLANGRVKVGGGSNKQRKMVMRIIYSKI